MAMVRVDGNSLQADSQVGGHPALSLLQQLNRVNSRSGCGHDKRTINFGTDTIITIIIFYFA